LKFWGSPWQPNFQNWAFNFPEAGEAMPREIWARIPNDTDVLVTHGPPRAILDEVAPGRSVGDHVLYERIRELRDLRLHIFGHIHEAYGREERVLASGAGITFVNASSCTKDYRPINPPVVVDF
jgi:Icc-related predicted phosphoesterase